MALNEEYKELPYYIVNTSENDRIEVTAFLRKHYYPDEPVSKYFGEKIIPLYENIVLKTLSENCSFKVVLRETSEIIGVRLSSLMKRDDNLEGPKDIANAVESKLILFSKFIEKQSNIFDMYPEIDVCLRGKLLCVNRKYRSLGIAPRLMKCSLDYMLNKRIPIFRVICTSAYSASVMRKMEFRELKSIDYVDYKDENGEQIIFPDPPHKAITWFIKEHSELEKKK